MRILKACPPGHMLRCRINRVAKRAANVTVMLRGESGTGKELVARGVAGRDPTWVIGLGGR